MKAARWLGSLAVTVCLAGMQAVGAPFVNLNFESAVVSGATDPWRFEPTEDLLPGWDLTFAGGAVAMMLVGGPPLGVPYALLADRRTFEFGVIEGRFSISLVDGFTDPFNPEVFGNYSLSQIGDIPEDSKSLRFQGRFLHFEVRIDGVPLQIHDEGTDDLWYSVSIEDFAGKNSRLEFLTRGTLSSGAGAFEIDSIQFSPLPAIPEPSSVLIALVGLGLMGLVNARRLRRRVS